jgi:hypothetical protein
MRDVGNDGGEALNMDEELDERYLDDLDNKNTSEIKPSDYKLALNN